MCSLEHYTSPWRHAMKLKPAIELTAPALEWLWPGYLATGNLAILDGDPGLGKSLITLDLAPRVTTGRPWPDGTTNPSGPASALLLCDEDVDSAEAGPLGLVV